MSEFSTPEQRTEMPTDRRMGKLREEGQIHFSNEIAQVLALFAGFYALKFIWGNLWGNLQIIFIKCFKAIGTDFDLSSRSLENGFFSLIPLVGVPIILLTVCVAIVAGLAIMLQTKWNVKSKKFSFDINRLNPIGGIKKIFSIGGFVQTAKAILKLGIVLPMGYIALKDFAPDMVALVHTSLGNLMEYIGGALDILFWKMMYIFTAFAIFDYFWGKYQWFRINKMTKDEIKDERKSTEGDEVVKRKIIQIGMQRIWSRIQMNIKRADVIVTNPTHYAIALKYERGSMEAPVVLEKGKGLKALRIRKIAGEAGIPIVERKPLARALYASAPVGKQIPNELFKAVAEVFAYLYRVKGNPGMKQPQSEVR